MQPRWYQQKIIEQVRREWLAGNRNVLAVSPPRSGKTPTAVWLSQPFIEQGSGVVINVHREELVRQMSVTFAAFGITHRIFAPKDVKSEIIRRHHAEFGRSFVHDNSRTIIGSVQTFVARSNEIEKIASRVGLWVTDEAHHCLTDNQWGKVIAMFPQAFGLGFTATPARTDRKSMARSQGGVFDAMVKGVTARQLIDEGYICDYEIVAPPSSIDREAIRVGSTGDYTQKGLSDATRESTITGDIVSAYQKYGQGRQAVVFCVDVEEAVEVSKRFNAVGIGAECVSAKTPKHVRKQLMSKFERGFFPVLCNVDLFGEGLNVEGIGVVIMARPTKSFVLFVQQFFRALTKADGKHSGLIIDLVGNVGYFGKFYGLPDSYNRWKLESEERGRVGSRDPDVEPVTTCRECFLVYRRFLPACPHCGHEPVPAGRSRPEQVEGDLVLLDKSALDALRREADRIMSEPVIPYGADRIIEASVRKKFRNRAEAQTGLRNAIAQWAGIWHALGQSDREIQKRFWDRFEVDVLTAQTLGAREAADLTEKVEHETRIICAGGSATRGGSGGNTASA